MIRTEWISSEELHRGACRLEGGYYCSEGATARRFLAKSGIKTCTLESLCIPNGIFIPQRFKRPYVRDAAHGIPYVTGSSICLANPLNGSLFLSRNLSSVPHREKLMLKTGLILVTSSGETGNAVYTGHLFDGSIGSPDLLRIIADDQKIYPGYLFAFLSSQMGRSLLKHGTYGGVIPHIEAIHVIDLPIPRVSHQSEELIHTLIEKALTNRVEANRRLEAVKKRVYDSTGLPQYSILPLGRNLSGSRSYTINQSSIDGRFEARYHDDIVSSLQIEITSNRHCGWAFLGNCADVFMPNRGKRFIVNVGGVPFISSGEMFLSHPRPNYNISMTLTPGIKELLVKENDILVARSGQIYSILGDVIIVNRGLAGMALTEHAIRVRVKNDVVHPGYLYAFLSLQDYGYGQIIRTAYGTSIPSIPPSELAKIVIPIPKHGEDKQIGEEVFEAINLRDQANNLEDQAQKQLQIALGLLS